MTGAETDLSVLLTLHHETLVAGPTLKSLEAAIGQVEQQGLRVERLLSLDNPSDACRAYVDQDAFRAWTRVDLDYRDQGRSRNHLLDMATGRWIAIADGDDMYSENWLAEAVAILRQPGNDRIIVHPELNWVFDAGQYVYTNPASDSVLYSEQVMTTSNYYDALCVAPRAAWDETRYANRDVKNGFAYEDYQWAVECTAKGWGHKIAQDTVIFKRRRDSSQTHEARRHKVMIREVDAHAIDAVGKVKGL